MLLQRIANNDLFSSLKDMQRLQQQLNRYMSSGDTPRLRDFPPIGVWASDNGVIVQTEIPGIEPDDVEVSLVNDTLTIRGSKKQEVLQDSTTCHRQERGFGAFTRSIQLPFGVDAEKVHASFKNGVLEIKLPRAEADKPRKISLVSE